MRPISVNLIWGLLLLATAVTYWLGESGQMAAGNLGPVLLILALALFKGLWVMDHFMELRHAPPLWRRIVLGWLLTVTALCVLAYWLARP
jgi:hypothetical protein